MIGVHFYPYVGSTDDVMAAVRRGAIDGQEARQVAAWWQAPSGVGNVLASFASGRAVDRSAMIDDVLATLAEYTAGQHVMRTADDDADIVAERTAEIVDNVASLSALLTFVHTAPERDE